MLDQEAEYLIINLQWEEAANNYLRILRELPGNANLMFRIGYCYLNADGKTEEAISYFEKALQNVSGDALLGSLREEYAPMETFLLLGTACQRLNRFDEAQQAYLEFISRLPEGDERHVTARQHLQSIDHARNFLGRPAAVEKTNLGRVINSTASNVNAVLSGDGQTMAFTNITRNGFEVFISRRSGDRWGAARSITRQLRRDYLLTSGLSYDGTELYLVYYMPDQSDIFVSRFEGGEWSRARSLGRPVNSRSNETHASVSADGKTLYFTSNREGGFGGLDIYRATLDSRGRWRDVVNMGTEINTPFNEETPFVTADGRYLFFSSEGHNSMGGYDIFRYDLQEPSGVRNMGYPVNNSDDNLFYFPDGDGSSGYISFYAEEGFGKKDIYRVSLADTHPFTAGDVHEPADIAELAGSPGDEPHRLSYQEDEEAVIQDEAAFVAESYEAAGEEAGMPSGITSPVEETDDEGWDVSDGDPADDTSVTEFYTGSESVIPFTHRAGMSYSVQFIALSEPVDQAAMDKLAGTDALVEIEAGGFSRFVNGYHTSINHASEALAGYFASGYSDAFVRINNYIPNYSIQLMATRNYVDPGYFSGISEIFIKKGTDGLYRVFWGRFSSYEEASENINAIRGSGYPDAFIRDLQEFILVGDR